MPKKITDNKSSVKGVWFQGRNTPVVVRVKKGESAVAKARKTNAAGSKGKVVSSRSLKGKSLSLARQGKWVRERSTGASPNSPEGARVKSKFRSGPVQQSSVR